MATAKTSSKANQASAYKANKTWETNRKKRLERTIRNQPNNEQAKLALKGMVYRRKTPGVAGWSATQIRAAKLFKEFEGRFDRVFFSPDPKLSQAWLQKQSIYAALAPAGKPQGDKGFFSLQTRVMQGAR